MQCGTLHARVAAQADKPTVTCGQRPELIYDYAMGSWGPEAYEVAHLLALLHSSHCQLFSVVFGQACRCRSHVELTFTQIKYPARGDPGLARRIVDLLRCAPLLKQPWRVLCVGHACSCDSGRAPFHSYC